MKIAVCYSGLFRTYTGWLENHKEMLPTADFYFSTWKTEEDKVSKLHPNISMSYFDQPIVAYNTYQQEDFSKIYGSHLQNKGSEKPRHYTSTLQHLGHYLISHNIPKKYDIIIRMRYDTILGKHNWIELVDECYNTKKSVGVGNTSQKEDNDDNIHNKPYKKFTEANSLRPYMLDFINIHLSCNIKNAVKMNEEENLWPTNAGWYQLLSKDFNGHQNYVGGIQLARYANQNIL